jgi:DNA-binding PadR family transcriptional regulator
MANKNSPEGKKRKPGIQALPEERKRGVTIRFLPEMKDDMYDLRDWLEREGNKGKRLLNQILKHEGKIDELLAKIKGSKKEEDSGLPPLPALNDLNKDGEIQALKAENQRLREMQELTMQEKAELEELRMLVKKIKQTFSAPRCIDQNGLYSNFFCQQFEAIKGLLVNSNH